MGAKGCTLKRRAFQSAPVVDCININLLRQLSPHVLIQSMRTSFCIYRLINRQNTGYNYQIWAIDARRGLLGVILSDEVFHSPALFSLLTPIFWGRNQRFIIECTLCWTVAWYRPQCEVSSKVSQNSVGSNPCGESMCLRYCFDRKMPGRFSARFSVRRVSFWHSRQLCPCRDSVVY